MTLKSRSVPRVKNCVAVADCRGKEGAEPRGRALRLPVSLCSTLKTPGKTPDSAGGTRPLS